MAQELLMHSGGQGNAIPANVGLDFSALFSNLGKNYLLSGLDSNRRYGPHANANLLQGGTLGFSDIASALSNPSLFLGQQTLGSLGSSPQASHALRNIGQGQNVFRNIINARQMQTQPGLMGLRF